MTDHVRVTEEDGGVLLVRMERPEKKNALTGAMYDALADAIGRAEGEKAGAVVLTGASGVFTAGNDLADFLAAAEGVATRPGPARRFIQRLASSNVPIVAAADGLAIGVGATLMLHCDLVYVTERTTLRMPFVDLGLVPEAGSSLLLPLRVGHAKAAEILMLGEAVSGAEAVRLGLANGLVDPGAVVDHALAKARLLAAKPRAALETTRRLLRGSRDLLAQAMDAEFAAFEAALRSPDAKAAFQTFMAKAASKS